MRNFYNITLGQLITVWVFGFFSLLLSAGGMAEEPSNTAFYLFLVSFIHFALIFYTIGWRNNRKKEGHKHSSR